MALTLESLNKSRATVIVDFQGEQIKVVFDPSLLTKRYLDTIENSLEAAYKIIGDIVVEWDLKQTAKDKKPLDVTEETVALLPLGVAREIVASILGSVNDGTAGKASGSTSNSEETQGSFQTGTS